MKIANIDAKEEDLKKINFEDLFSFIYDVVRPLEKELFMLMKHQVYMPFHSPSPISLPTTPIRTFEDEGYENVANLLHTIPIYLRNERSEAKCEDEGEDKIDLWGAYFSNTKEDNPYIELFIAPILDCVKANKQKFKWLFTKVLIHELAHAAMDLNNLERSHRNRIHNNISYHTDFGKWREESMANAVALRIIKEYGDTDFYNYAKSFMLSQPPEYALGVLMEDLSAWDFKCYIDNKECGVNNDLKQIWLDYVKNGNPSSHGLKIWNKMFCFEYAYCFKGKYYYGASELVVDIVMDELDKFEKEHGRKMTKAEFTDTFPNIRIVTRRAYEPSDLAKNNKNYIVIELEDGIYSLLRYSWDNRNLHDFIGKIKCDFEEYKNK